VNKFNLTFSGEILAGHDPAQVKLRFGKMFAIDDPVRLERFFSGQTIILRRNLERKDAAQSYHELHLLGAVAALVKVTTSDAADAIANTSPASKADGAPTAATTVSARNGAKTEPRKIVPGTAEQSWAVRSRVAAGGSKRKKTSTASKPVPQKAPEAPRREAIDIAAGIKARKQESLRQAAAERAQEQREREAQERQAAEELARHEAARRRREAEEVAQREARAAETRRKAEEEAARKEAELAESKRREAEEEARKQALKAEARRQAEEEAARRKLQQAQEKAERARLKAEKAALRKAELAAKKRREAEEAAQRRAELEEKKRREAEAAARRQAELEAKKRREAEAAARQQAQLQERKRREAEEAARRQAALEEQKRLAAEEAARLQAELEEIKRQEAEEAARLQAELEAIKQQEAAEAARIRAEAQHREAEAQRKSTERRRAAAEALAARRALRREEKRKAAAQRAALQSSLPLQETAPRKTPAAGKVSVKSRLEIPLHLPTPTAEGVTPIPRKRQPGEPNLYKLRPFRNTEEVRSRSALSRRRMWRSYLLGTAALAALLVAGGSFLRHSPAVPIAGANAVAIEPAAGPVLLTGDALLRHDRAGVSTDAIPLAALGLRSLEAPIAFDSSGALLARGQLNGNNSDAASGEAAQLVRCELPLAKCQPFSAELAGSDIRAFVINPVDHSVLLADNATGRLLKADRTGSIVAQAAAVFPERPVLRLHGGLLLMNSADGPGISVFRYEDSAFGNQLDEILLLPPAAQQAEQSSVGDFLWSGGAWWASMRNPQTGSSGLYRFDEEWNFLNLATLPPDTAPAQLVSWGEKTLVNDPQREAIQRFNAQGASEAPFSSTQMQSLIAGQQRRAHLTAVAWRSALLLCAVAAALSLGFGYLQGLRSLVYKPRRERGAEPVDEYTEALHWIDPVANRLALLRRMGINYGLLAFAVLLLAIAQNVSVWQLAALLIALSGPAIALLILSRQPVGHIGLLQDKLLLVDHSGMYHLAGGSGVQYRGRFLMIDDVAMFCGSRLFPAFSTRQIKQLVMPLARGGVKVDRLTVMVKLLQSRHPIALAACAILATALAAAVLLCLHGIF
jgi:hypothetical protein